MDEEQNGINRRDLLKGLVGVPVLGAFGISSLRGSHPQDELLAHLEIEPELPRAVGSLHGEPIHLGIIGFGIRGGHLLKAAGFATKEEMHHMQAGARRNPADTRLREFLAQEDLNVRITGVCDVFDVHAATALETAAAYGHRPRRFRHYQEMLESGDVDAVMIATPDHWHAPMAIAAARAGKHVYVEKCMTHGVGETYELFDEVKRSGIIFQVGHQHRQTDSFLMARAILKKGFLGHISLVQASTNRNGELGAWRYPIHPEASPETIDWAQFLGNTAHVPFDPERFFRWRKWWAYGTGLGGDMLTHDYDRINCLLEMGIPDSVMATGGIYLFRDGREVPDVFQVAMEYRDFSPFAPGESDERGMTFLYSATLGSEYDRSTQLMGREATMALDDGLTVYPERSSPRFKALVRDGTLARGRPVVFQAAPKVDATSGASISYFAKKGLMSTSRGGKRLDPTHLHVREWLSGIRNGGQPSCGIVEGFEEAISAHMATIALRLGRRVEWNREEGRIGNVTTEELESIGMA